METNLKYRKVTSYIEVTVSWVVKPRKNAQYYTFSAVKTSNLAAHITYTDKTFIMCVLTCFVI
jgi:hypothetical protein